MIKPGTSSPCSCPAAVSGPLRKHGWYLFPALLLLCLFPDLVSARNSTADSILILINRHRELTGLEPLSMKEDITSAACTHSSDMAVKRTRFGHGGFEKRAGPLLKKYYPKGGGNAAENVAYGQKSASEVVDGWLNSPGHRKNMEGGNFRYAGICVREGKGRVPYYTLIVL